MLVINILLLLLSVMLDMVSMAPLASHIRLPFLSNRNHALELFSL
jgi:hypothetical protein